MSMFDLKGRRGIITGASSGLGLAMANVLAEAGATVYALSRSKGRGGPHSCKCNSPEDRCVRL